MNYCVGNFFVKQNPLKQRQIMNKTARLVACQIKASPVRKQQFHRYLQHSIVDLFIFSIHTFIFAVAIFVVLETVLRPVDCRI